MWTRLFPITVLFFFPNYARAHGQEAGIVVFYLIAIVFIVLFLFTLALPIAALIKRRRYPKIVAIPLCIVCTLLLAAATLDWMVYMLPKHYSDEDFTWFLLFEVIWGVVLVYFYTRLWKSREVVHH